MTPKTPSSLFSKLNLLLLTVVGTLLGIIGKGVLSRLDSIQAWEVDHDKIESVFRVDIEHRLSTIEVRQTNGLQRLDRVEDQFRRIDEAVISNGERRRVKRPDQPEFQP